MRVMVVGSGGREHALCDSLSRSSNLSELICAPGSDAIRQIATIEPIPADNVEALVAFAQSRAVDLVVVGPEAPLALGLADKMIAHGIKVFGPIAAAARLESSKAFMKAFAAEHGIPTAAYRVFENDEIDEAKSYVKAHELPVVIKADGLAAGKGVTVAEDHGSAIAALEEAFAGAFGEAGQTVVVEEFLEGEEASLFAICDGRTALEIGTSQDHKRAFDGDQGPNTGGMGAYSPAPVLSPIVIEKAMAEIIQPVIDGMARAGTSYVGFLYAGLMISAAGPKLVEFNVRFGDPECQVVLPRLKSDLLSLIVHACDGTLDQTSISWSSDHLLTVVMAANGYPDAYKKGTAIKGLDRIADKTVTLFHAGTRREGDGWLANGGRVIAVTGRGDDLRAAHDKAYDAVAKIDWPEGFYRKDIGWRALKGS